MWVDAIYINQRDIFEKTYQVQMMGNIFSSASNILVWLGDTADGSDFIFDTIRSQNIDERDVLQFVHSLWKLYTRPWFDRI
jgi:hypothetical protein